MIPMPRVSEVFADVRGEDRTMRISLHPSRSGHRDTVVVSLWLGPLCRGSFRMHPGDLDRMMAALTEMNSAFRSSAAADSASGSDEAARGFAGVVPAAPADGSATARGTAVVLPLIEPTAERPVGEPVPGFGFGLPPDTLVSAVVEPLDDEEPGEVTGTIIDAGQMLSRPTGQVA